MLIDWSNESIGWMWSIDSQDKSIASSKIYLLTTPFSNFNHPNPYQNIHHHESMSKHIMIIQHNISSWTSWGNINMLLSTTTTIRYQHHDTLRQHVKVRDQDIQAWMSKNNNKLIMDSSSSWLCITHKT
jgi:hypothetical protein